MAKRFGVLQHRGAAQFMKGFLSRGAKEFSIRVSVERNVGAGRKGQFCSVAWIPKSGHARRRLGFRQSFTKCASTPTLAVKKALRSLGSRSRPLL